MLRFLVLFILLSFQTAWAEIELLYFKASNSPEAFLIPRRSEETPGLALQHYQDSLLKSQSFQKYFNNFSELHIEGFLNDLPHVQASLVVANDGEDMGASNRRLKTVLNPLKVADRKKNRSLAVLPIGSSFRLTPTERTEFHRKIAHRFSLLVLMGGADVHPLFYNEKVTHAKPTNALLDALEIRLARDYHRLGKGQFLCFCRGAQLTNIAFGNSMYQDVNQDGATPESHKDGVNHGLILQQTDDSFFAEAFQGQELKVNSYHHESVKVRKNSFIQVAAVSPDGIAEAFTSKDHRMSLTQFHAELEPTLSQSGQPIIDLAVARSEGKKSCSRAHGSH